MEMAIDPSEVLPEHSYVAERILGLDCLTEKSVVAFNEDVCATWCAAGNPAPEHMETYLQAFCLHIANFDESLARGLQATITDHGIDSGVPSLISRYFVLGRDVDKIDDVASAGHLMIVLRYLAIMRRLKSSAASKHLNLALIGRGKIETTPYTVNDPELFSTVFSNAMTVRQT